MKQKDRFTFYLFIFLLILFADRFSKVWALQNLENQDLTIFPGFNLALIWNRGVSWGLLSFDSSILFYLLTFLIVLVVILFCLHTFYLFKKGENIFFEVLIFGGAISNLIDRFYYKGVVDFIDFYVGSWHWPTFNLADVFVVIGVFGILGRFLFDGYFRKN